MCLSSVLVGDRDAFSQPGGIALLLLGSALLIYADVCT